MTADYDADIRASRFRVPRTRGAFSGLLLVILGLWAAIVPFIGPYFDFAFTPAPNSSWHWTSARLYLEVLPGAAAFLGGLLLLVSTSRVTTSFGAWLGVAGGAWLIVGPVLADPIGISIGHPDPQSGKTVQALEQLFFFYAIGAAIVFIAATALGRLSVHSIRDVRAARRRTEAEEIAAAEAAEAERRDAERRETARRDSEQAEVHQPGFEHDGVGAAHNGHTGNDAHSGNDVRSGNDVDERHFPQHQAGPPAEPQAGPYAPEQQAGPYPPEQQPYGEAPPQASGPVQPSGPAR